jgi:O-methyltransferase
MAPLEQAIRNLGYQLKDTVDNCLVSVKGEGQWWLDLRAQPIALHAVDAEHQGGQAHIELEAATLIKLLSSVPEGLASLWPAQGSDPGTVNVTGAPEVVSQIKNRLESSFLSVGRYAAWADLVNDPRMVFLNYGYSEPRTVRERLKTKLRRLNLPKGSRRLRSLPFLQPRCDEDFSWMKPEDKDWTYAINMVRHVVRNVEFTAKTILDVGCGRGGACSYFARYYRPNKICGLDYCEGNIEFCRSVHTLPNVSFMTGDAHNLPFEDGTFDIVTNMESSHNYHDLKRFFDEVRRVLKPGGIFCYADLLSPQTFHFATNYLSQMGEVRDVQDITDRVFRALELNASHAKSLLVDMLDHTVGNEPYIEDGIEELTSQKRQDKLYKSGGMYGSCQALFPRKNN